MTQRGRRPRDEADILQSADVSAAADMPVTATHRPRPPAALGDEAAHVWRRIVNARPADWFPAETHDLLASYCNVMVSIDRVQQLIDAVEQTADQVDIAAYDKLLASRGQLVNTQAMLMTRMRLTQQSRYSARRGESGGVPDVPAVEHDGDDEPKKPWE